MPFTRTLRIQSFRWTLQLLKLSVSNVFFLSRADHSWDIEMFRRLVNFSWAPAQFHQNFFCKKIHAEPPFKKKSRGRPKGDPEFITEFGV